MSVVLRYPPRQNLPVMRPAPLRFLALSKPFTSKRFTYSSLTVRPCSWKAVAIWRGHQALNKHDSQPMGPRRPCKPHRPYAALNWSTDPSKSRCRHLGASWYARRMFIDWPSRCHRLRLHLFPPPFPVKNAPRKFRSGLRSATVSQRSSWGCANAASLCTSPKRACT